MLPSRKTRTVEAMEEERRLAFVHSRAKDGLYLSEAEGFGHPGTPRYPSRFLLDIDPSALGFQISPQTPSSMTRATLMRLPIAGSLTWPGGLPSRGLAPPKSVRAGRCCRGIDEQSGPISSIRRFRTRRVAFRFASSWKRWVTTSKPEDFNDIAEPRVSPAAVRERNARLTLRRG